MALIIDLDIDKCSACGACAVACMDQNDIDTEQLEAPFRVVSILERGREPHCFTFLSVGCNHCTDAPCVDACPCGCIYKDAETGLTLYDNTNCIGCHSCAMACPFGAPSFNREGKMVKCGGCAVRVENGLEPACVRVCGQHALTLVTEEEYKKKHLETSLKKITDLIG